jgi:hypothetical protein
VLGGVVLDQSGAEAPAEEGADLRGALVDGVVGAATACDPGEEVRLGEVGGVPSGGPPEEVGESAAVVRSGLGVAVAAAEVGEDLGKLAAVGRKATGG